MIKALLMVFSPRTAWEKMAPTPPGAVAVLLLSVLPLLVLSGAAEGWSLVHWGLHRGEFGRPTTVPAEAAYYYVGAQSVFSLLSVFAGATILFCIARNFHVRTTFDLCLVTTGLSLCPVFFVRCFASMPALNPWLWWALGVVLCARSLYHAVALMLKPEQSKGFGLLLMGILVIVPLTGVGQFLAAFVLRWRLDA